MRHRHAISDEYWDRIKESRTWFQANVATQASRPRTLVCLSMQYFGSPRRERRGAIFPSGLANGTRSGSVLIAGPAKVFGSACSRLCKILTWSGSSWTQP